jgi:ADP-ribose pyrophosphatase
VLHREEKKVRDYSEKGALDGYMTLIRTQPELFQNTGENGIEILTTEDEILEACAAASSERLAEGMDVEDLRVGLLASDPFMMVMRDAVRFPNGSLGLYNRIVERSSVAILPLLNGQPVVLKIFRHGLRTWTLEFPRGARDRGETHEDAARRELREETGGNATNLRALGEFTPGGSSLMIRACLFAADIDEVREPDRREGIEEVYVVDVEEVERLIGTGEIIDGFTMATFLRARLAGIV